MKSLYVLSGASGMTGSELVRQILEAEKDSRIIGFDNFFASSIDTVKEYLDNPGFVFYEYDINNADQMKAIEDQVLREKGAYDRTVYINCAAVVHTEHFYEVEHTWETNVPVAPLEHIEKHSGAYIRYVALTSVMKTAGTTPIQ